MVPLLAHLTQKDTPREFGVYNALAVMAYLIESIHQDGDWAARAAIHLRGFPSTEYIEAGSTGIALGWLEEQLWIRRS
ncbi:hypothetical protein BHD05_03665 [Marisediminicola antarctica]|uniref:Uncharacterized protein n=1 Tax=Marisediminicola antarctica TaxID=674079 RepID=A0A7L5AIC0_9MICO|nr:hypothetical protein BHD05_03665 [Marisediminicola antarctica]